MQSNTARFFRFQSKRAIHFFSISRRESNPYRFCLFFYYTTFCEKRKEIPRKSRPGMEIFRDGQGLQKTGKVFSANLICPQIATYLPHPPCSTPKRDKTTEEHVISGSPKRDVLRMASEGRSQGLTIRFSSRFAGVGGGFFRFYPWFPLFFSRFCPASLLILSSSFPSFPVFTSGSLPIQGFLPWCCLRYKALRGGNREGWGA